MCESMSEVKVQGLFRVCASRDEAAEIAKHAAEVDRLIGDRTSCCERNARWLLMEFSVDALRVLNAPIKIQGEDFIQSAECRCTETARCEPCLRWSIESIARAARELASDTNEPHRAAMDMIAVLLERVVRPGSEIKPATVGGASALDRWRDRSSTKACGLAQIAISENFAR